MAVTTADASGSLTVAATAPQSTNGSRVFLGIGQTSGSLGAASYAVDAGLVMNPNEGSVGSTTTVEGFGFGPSESVSIYWKNPQVLLGSATANAQGSFTTTITVPSGALPGPNVIDAIANTRGEPEGPGAFTVR